LIATYPEWIYNYSYLDKREADIYGKMERINLPGGVAANIG
jgi:hypothetical protein